MVLIRTSGTDNLKKGFKPSARIVGFTDSYLNSSGLRYAPEHLLVINGVDIVDHVDFAIEENIEEIVYEDHEQLFDQLTIKLVGRVSDPVSQRSIPIPEFVADSTLFSEGNIIWLYGGYGGELQLIGGAEIVKREFIYGNNPSCTIIAYEPTYRMANVAPDHEDKRRWARRGSTTSMVKEIAKKPEYKSSVIGPLFDSSKIEDLPPVTKEVEVQKVGQSDFEFIRDLAAARGYNFYSRFDSATKRFTLYYGPDEDKKDIIYRYEYNNQNLLPEDQVIDFVPTINAIDQHSELHVIGLQDYKKETATSKQAYPTAADAKRQPNTLLLPKKESTPAKPIVNTAVYMLNIFGVSKKIIADRPFEDKQELKQFAVKWAREHIKQYITGTGKVWGNETLQSRMVISIMGLGKRLSGIDANPVRWYLTKVVHRFHKTEGYKCDFDCRQVIDWIPEDDIKASPVPKQVSKSKKNAQSYATKPGAKFPSGLIK